MTGFDHFGEAVATHPFVLDPEIERSGADTFVEERHLTALMRYIDKIHERVNLQHLTRQCHE